MDNPVDAAGHIAAGDAAAGIRYAAALAGDRIGLVGGVQHTVAADNGPGEVEPSSDAAVEAVVRSTVADHTEVVEIDLVRSAVADAEGYFRSIRMDFAEAVVRHIGFAAGGTANGRRPGPAGSFGCSSRCWTS